MKKFSILILSLILIFAFTSCSEGNVEYADSEVAKDLINSIKAEAVAEDLISAAGNGDVQGLDISYVFQTKGMTIEEALAADAVTIDVTGTFSNENGGYTNGFWNSGEENKGGAAQRAIISGSGIVSVTGKFEKGENNSYTFKIDSYTARTTSPVMITETESGKTVVREFVLERLEGDAEGTITRASDGTFSVNKVSLTVPTADKVSAFLDSDPIDYNKLCSDTGFKPGVSKVEYTPAAEN